MRPYLGCLGLVVASHGADVLDTRHLLDVMEAEPGCTVEHYAARAGLPVETAQKLLDALEQSGTIESGSAPPEPETA